MVLTEELVRAAINMKEEEARRARLVADAQAAGAPGRTWLWRVEPGMEEAFRALLGWLLAGQRHAPAEVARTASVPAAASTGREPTTSAAPDPVWACCPLTCCGQAL